MKGFVNTVLGLPFEETEAPEWQRLYERRERYRMGIVPKTGLFLTAGVDVQKDRIEVEVVAWGRHKESWLVDYQVIEGDTAPARCLGEAGRCPRPGLAACFRAHPADPGDVRRRGLCNSGRLRLGAAAPAGGLRPGRRRGATAPHRSRGQRAGPGHGAAVVGVEG
jgi:hypothetical protein